jgi:hypothetical protein
VDGSPEETIGWALDQPGPVLVEVIVGDSMEILKARAGGAARRLARRALGPSHRARVKRLLGRGPTIRR